MNKLSIEVWKDIFRNIKEGDAETIAEFGCWVETIWLDSTDEWTLGYAHEIFEDGFKTEEDALERLNEIEKEVFK